MEMQTGAESDDDLESDSEDTKPTGPAPPTMPHMHGPGCNHSHGNDHGHAHGHAHGHGGDMMDGAESKKDRWLYGLKTK